MHIASSHHEITKTEIDGGVKETALVNHSLLTGLLYKCTVVVYYVLYRSDIFQKKETN